MSKITDMFDRMDRQNPLNLVTQDEMLKINMYDILKVKKKLKKEI